MERTIEVIFLYLGLFLAGALFGQSADFLIVEKPGELRLLNSFEQTAATDEWLPFTAFRILDARYQLSDGYSTAMKVRCGAEEYFILTETGGQPVHIASAGLWKIYQASTYNDTVVLVRDINLFPGIAPGKNKFITLKPHEPAARLFSWNGWTYLRTLSGNGWARLNKNDFTNIRSAPTIPKIYSADEVQAALQSLIDETNTLLNEIFFSLNQISHEKKTAPQWKVSSSGKKIFCTFSSPDSFPLFKESTAALKREIENLFLGSGHAVRLNGSVIEIQTP